MNNIVNKIMKDGDTGTLIEHSKFPKECAIRFAQLMEDELQSKRNQDELPNSHQQEVFAVYCAIVKLTCQFCGSDDEKLLRVHKECLHVASKIREYEKQGNPVNG